MGSMSPSPSSSIAPTDTATSVASVSTATPENTNVRVVGGERVTLPFDYDDKRPLYRPHGKWVWANGLEISATGQGSRFSYGTEGRADIKVGRIKDQEIVYISKSFSVWNQWDYISPYLYLNASSKYLRPLQGDCVPWIIGAFHCLGGQIGIAQDLPHPNGWREADMFLEENQQAAVIAAYQKLHDRGVLHGHADYRHWLIGNDGKVTIVDFGLSRVVQRDEGAEDANVGGCSAQDIADEMRKVKFLLNYKDSRKKEFELARLQQAREARSKPQFPGIPTSPPPDSMTREENAPEIPTALPDLDQLFSAGEQWTPHHFQVIRVGKCIDIRKTAASRLSTRKPVAALRPFSPEPELTLTHGLTAAEISELQDRRVHRINHRKASQSPTTVSWITGNRVPCDPPSVPIVSLKRPREKEPADEFSDEDDDLIEFDDWVSTEVSSDSGEDMEVADKNGADKGKGKGRQIQTPVKKRQKLAEASASTVPESKRKQGTGNTLLRTESYYGPFTEFSPHPPSASGPAASSANSSTPPSANHPTAPSANRLTPTSANRPVPYPVRHPTPPPANRPTADHPTLLSADRPIPSSANRPPSSANRPTFANRPASSSANRRTTPKKHGNVTNVHSIKKDSKLLATEAVRSWHLFQSARKKLKSIHDYVIRKQDEAERHREDFLRTILNAPPEERKAIFDSVGQPDSFAVLDIFPNRPREPPARVQASKHLQDQRQQIVNTVVQRPIARPKKELEVPRVVDIKRGAREDEAMKRAAGGHEAMRMPTPIPQPVVSAPSPLLQAVLDRQETYQRVVIRRVVDDKPDLENDPEDLKDLKALEKPPPPISGVLDEWLVRQREEDDRRLPAKKVLDPERSLRPSTPGTPGGPGLNLGEEPDVDLSDMEDYEPDPIDEAAKQVVYDEAAAIEAGTVICPPEPPARDPFAKPRYTHGSSPGASSAAKRKRDSEDGNESIGPNPKKSKV